MQTLFSVVQGSNRLSFDEQDMITAGVEWAMAEIVRNPGVQQRIQDELDRVIGHERIINEADFSSLPYLECVRQGIPAASPPDPSHARPQGQDRRLRHPQERHRDSQHLGYRARSEDMGAAYGVPVGSVPGGGYRREGP